MPILTASARAPWGASAGLDRTVRARHFASAPVNTPGHAPWGPAVARDAIRVHAPWSVGVARDTRVVAGWTARTPAARRHLALHAPWAVAVPTDRAKRAPWGRYEAHLALLLGTPWGVSVPVDNPARAPWGEYVPADTGQQASWGVSVPVDDVSRIPWSRAGTQLTPGVVVVTPPGDPDEPIWVLPVKDSYMQINTVLLRQVPDDIPMNPLRMSMGIDRDSWTWNFSATLPREMRAYLEPDGTGIPREMEAQVNGTVFRFLAEKVGADRAFGGGSVTISGRGLAAFLDRPLAPNQFFRNTDALTANQLAESVMTVNGVPIGWTIDWQPVDWLIPANLWTHQGTYVSALTEIAASAGAYVQAHPSLEEFAVQLHYPILPWEWGEVAPDYELPPAGLVRENTDWLELPRYNRVYVQGQQVGINGQVTRGGTAGDVEAPMVVDRLGGLTVPSARQRAAPVLAYTGTVANMALRMPLYAETGIIMPGKLVRYLDEGATKVGITRGVSLECSFPDVWQTITVETHFHVE